MRAVVVQHPGTDLASAVAVVDHPEPEVGPGELLIEVIACALCRTDLQLASGELEARALPVIPGHQVVGRVRAVGAGVAPTAARPEPPAGIGDLVGLVWLAGSCGMCRFCRTGRENLCLNGRFTGWDRDGGMAQLVSARAEFVHRIPDSLVPAELAERDCAGGAGAQAAAVDLAPLLCGGVIGFRSLHVAGVGPQSAGLRLGLYGFGASATIALQLANHFGVENFVVTRSAAEGERALALGASWAGTYDQRPPHPLDAAITFAPAGQVVLAALRACDRGATVAINAIHLDGIPAFDYQDLWWERSLRSVANVTRADVREFLELVGPAGVRTAAEALPLAEAVTAFERLRTGDVSGALVLVP